MKEVLVTKITTHSANTYELKNIIGEGTYGVIYKAKQTSTGQVVAIKLLKPPNGASHENYVFQTDHFDKEVRLYSKMNHTNIVKLLDKGITAKNEPFFVFEYIEGLSLRDIITDKKLRSFSSIKEIMSQLLDGINHAFEKGIVHCDLKPQNIMVLNNGLRNHIKILDFGTGTFSENKEQSRKNNIFQSGNIEGTPNYCSPEQLRGETPSIKSDIYSWGLILAECLTGEMAIQGESISHILQQQLSNDHVSLPSYILKHPIGSILRKVLMKTPALRAGDPKRIYEEFLEINLETLDMSPYGAATVYSNDDCLTIANPLGWQHIKAEKRFLSILCIEININNETNDHLDLETFDIVQKNQINNCIDTVTKYGGHVAEQIANIIVIYFGYPSAGDDDTRMAGKAAIEVLNQVNSFKSDLFLQKKIILSAKIAIHSGTLLSNKDEVPSGPILNESLKLLHNSSEELILIHKSSKNLFEKYFVLKSHKNGFVLEHRKDKEFEFNSIQKPLYGREKEFKEVLLHWSSTKSNNTILVSGQAGIGKSKLVSEVKSSVAKSNNLIFHSQCSPEHQNDTLYPIFNLLKNHLKIDENTLQENIIKKLEEAVKLTTYNIEVSLPILCSWFSISYKTQKTSSVPPENQREFVLNLLQELFLSFGNGKKFLILIEDIHWIDPTSESFIEKLITKSSGNNCFLLLSSRSNSHFFSQKTLIKEIALSPLNKFFVKSLAESLLNGLELSDDIVELIYNKTDGIALYIEELTTMLIDKKLIKQVNNKYELSERIEDLNIPSSLTGLLQSRLKSVGLAIETAQIASIIGREFSYNLLVNSSLKEKNFVNDDLDILIRSNIVYKNSENTQNYIFKHALIRDAAFESIASFPKKETHKRIGENIKNYPLKLREQNIQRLAYHYHEAEEYKHAIGFYKQAANLELLKKLGQSESIYLTDKALFLNENLKSEGSSDYMPLVEAELRIHKAAVLTYKSGWKHPEIIDNYRIVESLAKNTQFNNEVNFALAKGMWVYECTEGNIPRMFKLAEEMKKTARAIGDSNCLAQAYDCLSQTQFFNGQFKESIQSCHDCYNSYDQHQGKRKPISDGLDPYVVCMTFEALSQLFLGEKKQSINLMKDALNKAKSYRWSNLTMGVFAQTSRLYLYLCSFSHINEQTESLFKDLNDNVELFGQKGAFPYWESAIHLNNSASLSLCNNDESTLVFQKARKKWAPKTSSIPYYNLIEVVALIKNKAFKKALQITNESITFAEKNKIIYALAYAYCFKGKALFNLNKKDEAFNAFIKAIKIAESQKALWIKSFVTNEFVFFYQKKQIPKVLWNKP
ncbi:TOMM system kinase/cyclase fusion protein [Tenacibaculum sp. MAR_2009_124]|uniref:protein kinase domain-containing protein n=1 Tax=Tenacibaculum sp. MAR_2009_124 TaxID=1250059 RepID=UPI0008987E66|nr:protein kinase [Tenacibaculum sp. MAR_2009_124]SED15515.1 TOMM system kinase/cyclase fusion protein [Tenacibaculum sp. MAR_2009_124]